MNGDWFTLSTSLSCDAERRVLRFERGRLLQTILTPRLDAPCAFGFRASADIWRRFFTDPPEPLYHDVFAMLMRVPGFVLEGDTLVAMQHARALHRAMTLMRGVSGAATGVSAASRPPEREGVEPVVGRYLNVPIDGVAHRIFFEEAGAGVPLLCLHTAGADSRQYRHLLSDPAVTDRFRVVAFDLPYHGRSNPPVGWWRHRHL